MNKRFKIISLMSEALSLELEDVTERDSRYETIFRNDFSEEIRFLMMKEQSSLTEPAITSPKEIENQIPEDLEEVKILKDIYRALARATHPDVAGEEKSDEFKELSTAYIAKDIVSLIAMANRNQISPNIDDEGLDHLQMFLEWKRN